MNFLFSRTCENPEFRNSVWILAAQWKGNGIKTSSGFNITNWPLAFQLLCLPFINEWLDRLLIRGLLLYN